MDDCVGAAFTVDVLLGGLALAVAASYCTISCKTSLYDLATVPAKLIDQTN